MISKKFYAFRERDTKRHKFVLVGSTEDEIYDKLDEILADPEFEKQWDGVDEDYGPLEG